MVTLLGLSGASFTPKEHKAAELAGTDNLLPFIKDALRDRASMGEVCGAMKDVFGEYRPSF
jgi:methylmalonyl-CoA mutase N-terminal domain/subunit